MLRVRQLLELSNVHRTGMSFLRSNATLDAIACTCRMGPSAMLSLHLLADLIEDRNQG